MLSAIQELIHHKEQDLWIAVAYWGKDAINEIGLTAKITADPKRVRVICDLMTGSCNPEPIRSLIKRDVQVRTLDGMHAKVWICGDRVITGSANASINGLGYDDTSTLTANSEAAILSESNCIAVAARKWFNEIWIESNSKRVGEEELLRAEAQWKEKRPTQSRRERLMLSVGEVDRQLHDSLRKDKRFSRVVRHYFDIENSNPYWNGKENELATLIAERGVMKDNGEYMEPGGVYFYVTSIRVLEGKGIPLDTVRGAKKEETKLYLGRFWRRNKNEMSDQLKAELQDRISRFYSDLDFLTRPGKRRQQ